VEHFAPVDKARLGPCVLDYAYREQDSRSTPWKNIMQIRFLRSLTLASLFVSITAHAQTGVTSAPQKSPPKTTTCEGKDKSVPCNDTELYFFEGKSLVQGAFSQRKFKEADELLDKWSKGVDRFPDGTWKLAQYGPALQGWFTAWKRWDEHLADIKEWQKRFPDSFGAKLAEAEYWRAYAWQARGDRTAKWVTDDGWKLFRERNEKASAILTELEPKAERYPSWYLVRVSLDIDSGRKAEAEKAFAEGQKRFPEFQALYFAISRMYQPKWGGSLEAYDRFARDAAKKAAAFEAEGMYSRMYWLVDGHHDIPFESEKSRYPNWKMLKTGFDKLEARYPNSVHNLAKYASFACRSNDSALYRRLRSKIDGHTDGEDYFDLIPMDACDLRHKWQKRK
jgi:hypothetical protein